MVVWVVNYFSFDDDESVVGVYANWVDARNYVESKYKETVEEFGDYEDEDNLYSVNEETQHMYVKCYDTDTYYEGWEVIKAKVIE